MYSGQQLTPVHPILSGAGMQPLAQAVMLESFPKEKHGSAMVAYGMGIILAPILGRCCR